MTRRRAKWDAKRRHKWRRCEAFALRISAGVCLIEFRPDNRMIRSAGDFARGQIDFGGAASRGHDSGRQYMVDAPAEVPLEGVAEEIPVGVLNDIRVEFAEDI